MSKRKARRIETGGPGAGAQGNGSGPNKGGENPSNSPAGLTHSPFAALGAKLGFDPAPATKPVDTPDEASPGAGASVTIGGADLRGAGTVILRHERKGHGGKTVTICDFERIEAACCPDLRVLAKDLAKRLGLGARAVGREVVLQGDVLERAQALLQDRYGASITLGTRR